jgi:hypothetical protein
MSTRQSARLQEKKRKREDPAEAEGGIASLTDLPPDVLLRIHELIRGNVIVEGSGLDKQKHRYVSESRGRHASCLLGLLTHASVSALRPPTGG